MHMAFGDCLSCARREWLDEWYQMHHTAAFTAADPHLPSWIDIADDMGSTYNFQSWFQGIHGTAMGFWLKTAEDVEASEKAIGADSRSFWGEQG